MKREQGKEENARIDRGPTKGGDREKLAWCQNNFFTSVVVVVDGSEK